MSALNTSPEIHLLSEVNAYREQGERNFRARFNAIQAGYGLQTSKATYAPLLPGLADDADCETYFAALSLHQPIFGEKLALTTPRFGHDIHRLRAWIERRRPHCLFVFRHPEPTLRSMAAMFPYLRPQENVHAYAMTVCLYLDLARVLPEIAHVVHEEIAPQTFCSLGRWLGVDLRAAHDWYDERDAAQPPPEGSEMAALVAAYDFLTRSAREGGRLAPAMAQIGGFMGENNKSELARVYYSLTQVMEANHSFTLPE